MVGVCRLGGGGMVVVPNLGALGLLPLELDELVQGFRSRVGVTGWGHGSGSRVGLRLGLRLGLR